METDKFVKVVTGTLVRVSTMVNGQRTFSVAYCIGMKRASLTLPLTPTLTLPLTLTRYEEGAHAVPPRQEGA